MPKKKPLPGQLEIDSNFHEKPHVQQVAVRKKHPKRQLLFKDSKPDKGWMIAGFDVSMSSVAGAAIAYDAILDKMKGPVFVIDRWTKEDHYFDRLKGAAKAHDYVHSLQAQLLISISPEKVFIVQEEPWPPHGDFVKRGDSGWLKQQAEMSGAFLGGLVRYGFQNVSQIGNIRWRTTVANELGITTHVSKWKNPDMPKGWAATLNVAPKDLGKFRAKQWATQNSGYAWQHAFTEEVPVWPDIIESQKHGKIPRPETSRAKAVQPDDRYDALAICWTHYLELEESGVLDKQPTLG